jgi:hypothetical protein
MSPIIKENKDIPPEPPEILKTLRWLQLHWKRHWKLITVAGLILTTPLIWKGLSLLLSQRTQMPPVIMNTVADLESSDPDQQLEAIRNLSKLNHPAARKASKLESKMSRNSCARQEGWFQVCILIVKNFARRG